MRIDLKDCAKLLLTHNNILIISHKAPDGDTLGSAFALLYGLKKLGKTARVECSDSFQPKYEFIDINYEPDEFEPEYIVAVDIADKQLFGEKTEKYTDSIDLCIDHHISNTEYAKNLYLDVEAAATAEAMYMILCEMGVEIDELIARSLYTGISTDTGCFKYSSTTARTHIIASKLFEIPFDHARIDKIMFDTLSHAQIKVEQMARETIEYHFNGAMASIAVTKNMLSNAGVGENEIDSLTAIPRKIEGVEVAVVYKEREGGYKISMRSVDHVNVAQVCSRLGGGGHKRAAGCFIEGDLEIVKKKILEALASEFN